MPIYTNDPYDDGLFPVEPSLRSSIGIGPKVTKAIDAATKDWLDDHPEATTTVKDDSITNVKLKDGSVNSRTIENESITTYDIADLAITTSKIADNAVTAAKIASAAADGLRTMSTAQPGVAKVGAGLAMNNGAIELDGNGDIASAVTAWLNAHPEATTTVQDNSITDSKLVQNGGILSNLYRTLTPDLVPNSYWPTSGTPGIPTAYNGWSRTDRIPCKAGETIIITVGIRSPYNIFFNSDTDGDVNTSFTLQAGENRVVVPDDAKYFALSNSDSEMQNTIIKQFIDVDDIASKQSLEHLEQISEENKDFVDSVFEKTNLYTEIDFAGAVVGSYVDNLGGLAENNACSMLAGIRLKKGQTMHMALRGTTTMSTLARYLDVGSYQPLLFGAGGTTISEQEYTATEDMTVVISYTQAYEHSAQIWTDVTENGQESVYYCTPSTGFYAALEEIRSDESARMRTLYVLAGEYDLYEELGGDTYAESCIPDSTYNPPAAAWKHFSVVCPERLRIVGLGEVVLKMNIPANTWPTDAIPNSVLSPLSFRYGCEVENITVECSNTRYGIHIEGSGEESYRNARYSFKNVSIIYTFTDKGYPSAIGCGLNAGCDLEVDSCVLKVFGQAISNCNGIKGHLNDGSANVYVNDCFIDAPTSAFNVEWNFKGKDSRFRFVNTMLDDVIMSNGNNGNTPFTITYEMIRTDATMKRPSDTTVTMPDIVNFGSELNIEQW